MAAKRTHSNILPWDSKKSRTERRSNRVVFMTSIVDSFMPNLTEATRKLLTESLHGKELEAYRNQAAYKSSSILLDVFRLFLEDYVDLYLPDMDTVYADDLRSVMETMWADEMEHLAKFPGAFDEIIDTELRNDEEWMNLYENRNAPTANRLETLKQVNVYVTLLKNLNKKDEEPMHSDSGKLKT